MLLKNICEDEAEIFFFNGDAGIRIRGEQGGGIGMVAMVEKSMPLSG